MTGNELATLYEAWMIPAGMRALRHDLGLTQVQLAERLGVGEETIYRWERGTRTPTISALVKLRRLVEGQAA